MSRSANPAASEFPLSGVPAGIAEPLRPYLEAAASEMVGEIQALVPEYARPPESRYGRRMRWAVERGRCVTRATSSSVSRTVRLGKASRISVIRSTIDGGSSRRSGASARATVICILRRKLK